MKTLRAIVTNLSGIMYIIAGIALIAMVTLTVADVTLRMFSRPIMGTYELVGLLGAIMVSFAIPQTSRAKGHVVMDFLQGKLPVSVDKAFHVITRLLGIGLFIIIGWQLWLLGADYQRLTEVTVTLHLPQYPFCYSMAICCFVQCVELFLEIFQLQKEEQQS